MTNSTTIPRSGRRPSCRRRAGWDELQSPGAQAQGRQAHPALRQIYVGEQNVDRLVLLDQGERLPCVCRRQGFATQILKDRYGESTNVGSSSTTRTVFGLLARCFTGRLPLQHSTIGAEQGSDVKIILQNSLHILPASIIVEMFLTSTSTTAGTRTVLLATSTNAGAETLSAAEEFECRVDAAGAVRDAGAVQAHFDPAQRAAQHQIVEPAEMADAEDLALQPAEPVPSDMSKPSRMISRSRSAS